MDSFLFLIEYNLKMREYDKYNVTVESDVI